MFVRLPLHLTIITVILKVIKTKMFQVTDLTVRFLITIIIVDNHKIDHPFVDPLKHDWQSLRQRYAPKKIS